VFLSTYRLRVSQVRYFFEFCKRLRNLGIKEFRNWEIKELISMDARGAFEAESGKRVTESMRPFFWDVDFASLSVHGHSYFIIGRLMEHGNVEALRFLMRTYSRQELAGALKTSRSLSKRSRKFWALLLDVKEESCSPKRYLKTSGSCCWD
jgi:hypothetical protein